LVDLSNFVMLDLAQPNHLFDLARLDPRGIVVRDARAGERMRTLDGVERALTGEDMLICAGDEPVAIAGVMGGEASKVTPETSRLFLEAASFHPTRVRRTAARLGLRTDASARFEKNLSPTLAGQAAAHLVNLLRGLQPGIRLQGPAADAGPWKDPATTVALRPERVRAVLGKPLADAEIERILAALELGVAKGTPWRVSVPSERATKDLRIEEDLIEEVGRMHGYGNIAGEALEAPLSPAPRDERRALVRALQDHLAAAAGFHEAMTYSFLEAEAVGRLGLEEQPHVEIVNPQIEGLNRVRRSVAPSLLAHLAHNRRQRAEVRLFEIGKGYEPEHADERGEPRERHECALVWMAPRAPMDARFDQAVFERLKGVLEDLLAAVGRPVTGWQRCVPSEIVPWAIEWAHSHRAVVSSHADTPVVAAWLAALDPEVQARLGLDGELDGEVAVARIDIDSLLRIPAQQPRFQPLPRFPGVKVDVAVALPEERSAREVAAALVAAGKSLVERTELFDLYRGSNLGPGRKSLAYHVHLRAPDRTLDDGDCAKYLARLERALTELGAELRRG
jgi:phenylalanyl-tRNA synthetase beta chain